MSPKEFYGSLIISLKERREDNHINKGHSKCLSPIKTDNIITKKGQKTITKQHKEIKKNLTTQKDAGCVYKIVTSPLTLELKHFK